MLKGKEPRYRKTITICQYKDCPRAPIWPVIETLSFIRLLAPLRLFDRSCVRSYHGFQLGLLLSNLPPLREFTYLDNKHVSTTSHQ